MPSVHEQVAIPPELDSRIPLAAEDDEDQTAAVANPAFYAALVALLLMVLSSIGIGVGVGAWASDWGAGLAAGCLPGWVTGVLLAFRS